MAERAREKESNTEQEKKYKANGTQARTQKAKEATIEALNMSLGIISTACQMVGISRTTFYKWREQDADFRKAVEDIEERQKDFAESALLKNIKAGDTQSILFYLRTKGKDRGYTERTEIQADITSGGKRFVGFSSVLPQFPNIEEVIAEQERNRKPEE